MTEEYNMANKTVVGSAQCVECGGEIGSGRASLSYKTCLVCGEVEAREIRKLWCVVPMPKSNYILVTDPTLLLGLNSSHKGGVR